MMRQLQLYADELFDDEVNKLLGTRHELGEDINQ